MSLINEALKKAQRQRSDATPPGPAIPGAGDEPLIRIPRRPKPVGFDSLIARLGLGLLLVLGITIGGYYVATILTAPTENPVASQEPSSPPPASASATNPATASSAPTDSFKVGDGSPPAPPSTESASAEVVPAPVDTPPPVASVPRIELPPTPTRMETQAIAYLEGLRISGIRASPTDAKVLMNDRVYRVGDTVEHELGLTLVEIRANSLTFENAVGLRYTRGF